MVVIGGINVVLLTCLSYGRSASQSISNNFNNHYCTKLRYIPLSPP